MVLLLFLVLSYGSHSDGMEKINCSMMCTGRACGSNIKTALHCALNCSAKRYKDCWTKAIEAINYPKGEPSARKFRRALREIPLQQVLSLKHLLILLDNGQEEKDIELRRSKLEKLLKR